ncbi:Mrp/NBP35 family ATP-binding protein [Bacteroidales bacterium OttesenSCG-928-K03]|nr:Mrp/NBP35 family ATP-binding protein [Bacteroidales bacterium OttesenSCG-928-L14]MDL2242113.1 Mrp/NBP35 family ATP-binding protein [Bacteroidales bacterium OttesenSCG-928-K03]
MTKNNLNNKIENTIVVASGKGGVGKSTVAVNIAVALAQKGYKVGILDADIYGPSIPIMLGLKDAGPQFAGEEGNEIFIPYEKYGVKISSIGFYVEPEQALIWRGPMAASVFTQLLNDTDWGELDYLIIDSPPGTGDIQLTLVQSTSVTGAVIVTTPQQVAVADARKAISMFRKPEIKVPVLGIVENMSWFTPAEHPENKYYLFGKDGGKKTAEEFNVPLLGQIPLIQSICESGDIGEPTAHIENKQYQEIFSEITNKLIESILIRNAMLKPTEPVKIDENAKGCGGNN